MKKITVLLMLLTVTLGYSDTLTSNSSSNDPALLNRNSQRVPERLLRLLKGHFLRDSTMNSLPMERML